MPVDVNYWTDGNKYRVKVMDDVVVYLKRTDSTIYIGKLGSNTHLISRKLDTTSSAKFFVDIQKSNTDYLVVVAHETTWSNMNSGNRYVWFYKVSGNSASLITYLRNSGSSSGDDKNFHNVACSPNTQKCYAESTNRDYYTGDNWIYMTQYTVNLAGSSVLKGAKRKSCGDSYGEAKHMAVSNDDIALVCNGGVYVYSHGDYPSAHLTISKSPEFAEFSPDGKKLLLSFYNDQGSEQYMEVYRISDGVCLVGPDQGCTNSL